MPSSELDGPSTSAYSAIVTGAAQGIGRTVAIRLARSGYNVAVTDLPSKAELLDSVVAEITALGRTGLALPGDVRNEADVDEAVTRTVKELGPLYIVRCFYFAAFCCFLLKIGFSVVDGCQCGYRTSGSYYHGQ